MRLAILILAAIVAAPALAQTGTTNYHRQDPEVRDA
jgi:hypothetical protein